MKAPLYKGSFQLCLVTMMAVMGAAFGFALQASDAGFSQGCPERVPVPFSQREIFAELLEEKNRTIHRSEPLRDEQELRKRNEEDKEDRSWQMLRELVIIPQRKSSREAPDNLGTR